MPQEKINYIELKIKDASENTGVYSMLDKAGKILYVGKANNLRSRLKSYISPHSSAKVLSMMSKVHDISVTITQSESEALILEQNLIKKNKPQYNIIMRDDKSYPYFYLSSHKYPRLSMKRGNKSRLKGKYFGPYVSVKRARLALDTLHAVFQLRNCSDAMFNSRKRPCLEYEIGRCSAPCVGLVHAKEYQEGVHKVERFLQHKNNNIILDLAHQMQQLSVNQNYEKAAKIRNQVQALASIQVCQIAEEGKDDLDVLALTQSGRLFCLHILEVRQGKISASYSFHHKSLLEETESKVMSAYISQRYIVEDIYIPIILTSVAVESSVIEILLSHKIDVIEKRTSRKYKKFFQIAEQSSQLNLKSRLKRDEGWAEISYLLHDPVSSIECFDISHIQGKYTQACCITHDQEGKVRSRIYDLGDMGGDDCAAIGRAVSLHYQTKNFPNLVLIDGGVAQLKAASLHVDSNILLLGITKDSTRSSGLEKILLYRDGCAREIKDISTYPMAFLLLQNVRDKTHNGAINAHRKKSLKSITHHSLSDIEGVGGVRMNNLLQYFGGVAGLKKASIKDIQAVKGIGFRTAQAIYDRMR